MRLVASSLLLLVCLAAPLRAEQEDPTPEATRLKEEAQEFFDRAGNADLPHKERKVARQEAFKRLVEARIMLDAWLETHPDAAARLDDLYVDIAAMMYWIRKEAAIGELAPYPPPDPDTPDETEPGIPEPAPPEEPKGPTPAEALAKIREYERRFPGDVPGLHERYKRYLTTFPDSASDEYEQAALRLEALDRRLKDVYRLARDDDPDALSDVDDKDLEKLIRQLGMDLEKGSEPVQVRAARFLGGLGSGKAAPLLMASLSREKAGPVFDAAADALARIGGRRVTSKLLKVKANSKLAPTVVSVLLKTLAGGGVNARIAGEAVAVYAVPLDLPTRHRVAAALFDAGKPGAVGLSIAVHEAPVEKKVQYIGALGELRDPRTAGNLAGFLVVNVQGARKRQARAARKAILAIGKPGVPYLIPALDDKRCAVWTAELLRQICGVKLKDDRRRTWEKWYRKNRRRL